MSSSNPQQNQRATMSAPTPLRIEVLPTLLYLSRLNDLQTHLKKILMPNPQLKPQQSQQSQIPQLQSQSQSQQHQPQVTPQSLNQPSNKTPSPQTQTLIISLLEKLLQLLPIRPQCSRCKKIHFYLSHQARLADQLTKDITEVLEALRIDGVMDMGRGIRERDVLRGLEYMEGVVLESIGVCCSIDRTRMEGGRMKVGRSV